MAEFKVLLIPFFLEAYNRVGTQVGRISGDHFSTFFWDTSRGRPIGPGCPSLDIWQHANVELIQQAGIYAALVGNKYLSIKENMYFLVHMDYFLSLGACRSEMATRKRGL